MPIHLATEKQLRAAYAAFAADPSQRLRLTVRRNRAAAIRDLMSRRDLDLSTFNREVWAFESDTVVAGSTMKGVIPSTDPIPEDRLAQIQKALADSTLELHGNYTWGSATKVFGAQVPDKDVLRDGLRRAQEILAAAVPALEKAKRLMSGEVKGFGENVGTGLVMMFHPDEFAIFNGPSQAAVRFLGLTAKSLDEFEAVAAELKTILGCPDFLALDWFLFLILDGAYPGVFPFSDHIHRCRAKYCTQDRIAYRREKEREALALLMRTGTGMTREDLEAALELLNSDFHKGGERADRFGQAITGNNRNQILDSATDLAGWIDRLLKAPASEIAPIISQYLKSGPLGAGPVFGSLVLYLRDPEQYSIWAPAMREGLTRLTRARLNGKSGSAYFDFNEEVQRFRKAMQLEPQEMDLLLSIDTDPPVPDDGVMSEESLAMATSLPRDEIAKWLRAIARKKQAIIYGPPGTGKTFVARHVARYHIRGGDGFLELLQFHPTYAYEDFIQGLRPVAGKGGGLEYVMVAGRFKDFCARAQARKGRCVLIIDEINRANLSKVFGELMYLLEYRDESIPLAGGESFQIPGNVIIIGTMNTADRSIALVDHALRRRFAFLPLYPNYAVLEAFHAREKTGFAPSGLIGVLNRVNEAIGDRHHSVGISFFLARNLRDCVQDIWQTEIEPYLEELFFDQPRRAAEFAWDKIRSAILGA
jgi:MoxR-like ATPase